MRNDEGNRTDLRDHYSSERVRDRRIDTDDIKVDGMLRKTLHLDFQVLPLRYRVIQEGSRKTGGL